MQQTLEYIRGERQRLGLPMTEIMLPRLARALHEHRRAHDLSPGAIAARAGKDKAKWGGRVAAFERGERGIDFPTLCAVLPAYGMPADEIRRLVDADHDEQAVERAAARAQEELTARWRALGHELLLAAIPGLLANAETILATPRYAACPAPGECSTFSSMFFSGGVHTVGELVAGWSATDLPADLVPEQRCECGRKMYFFSGSAGFSLGEATFHCCCGKSRDLPNIGGLGMNTWHMEFRQRCPRHERVQPADFVTMLEELGIAHDARKAAEYRALAGRATRLSGEAFGGFRVRGRGPLLKLPSGA